ncbi:hypothetical protein JD844_028881 [Phrynosoma platyrhinos]|uniref:Inter-alpha-trypsin inhibitor heavy chain H3 n=1 Tax=Phrynosoma platyrhinos TaxID=52577 RepID=A0ABQ7SIG4_PHRPL|nr:hypothetical protein JD844_028881 [Phrynosoma platyrhinos]
MDLFQDLLCERADSREARPTMTTRENRYKVHSTITSRLANTMVQTKVENRARHSQNLVFDVQIPKGAFIHNFTMNVNGITFTSSVKEKSAARSQYAQAKAKGKAAGLLSPATTTNHMLEKTDFDIQMDFQYHIAVDIHIIEPQGLSFVHVPKTLGDQFKDIVTISKGEKKAHVSFKPTVAQQRQCPTCSSSAIDGNFVVTYDVKRESKAGELEIFNGYFIHYFAPENLDPLPKNILFVIDVSGSMWGLKMKQFSVLDFNHNVRCWRDSLVQASKLQTEAAKKYIEGIHPNGGTNINDALLRAIFILKEASNLGMLDPHSVSMIVLVSDGDPTVGELKLPAIQKNVQKNIRDDISLFCLGIGFDVDYDFLKRLAHENNGMAHRDYTGITLIWKKQSLNGNSDATLCSGSLVIGQAPTENPIPSWVKPTSKPGGPLAVVMGPTISAIHAVDNDPHFIINLPRQQQNICFNIDSEPDAILNLISDAESGITINGQLVGAKKSFHNKLNTYFGKIGFSFEKKGLKVEVSTEAITLKDGSSSTSFSWSDTGSLIRRRLQVSVKRNSNVTITVDGDLSFMVVLHRVWKKHPVNVDFLGIYIPPASNFSSGVHGLIGLQKDYRLDRVFGTGVHCWFVHNNGKGFLDGHYSDYLVPNLYSYLKHL